ncbi:MAG: hypothetical protein IPP72_11995 [Chitinophagaceae bacterium]|nr:hypothetical protein [Chitinophagaceae bacterium]
MKRSKLFLTAALLLLSLLCNQQDCFAEVTSITNSLMVPSFTSGSRVPIFKSRPNLIRVSGSWLDTTNDIDGEGLQGQPNFNIGITSKGNMANPYVEFTLNSDRTGRYRVRLKRPGGEDVITIEYTDHISIASTQALTMSNATPAYLDAFAINTEIRLRITGTNVNQLSFKPLSANYTISTPSISAAATKKDIGYKYSRKVDKVSIQQSEFVFTACGREFKYSDYKGNSTWNVNNLPFFRAYDKPDFLVSDVVSGIYNRRQGTCGAINNNGNIMIERPGRCDADSAFRLANPTAANPLVEKEVIMSDVVFTIINDSYAPQLAPITIHVKFGINIRGTITINRMIAKEVKQIQFHRPESRKILVRHFNCSQCFEKLVAPFDWADESYTVVVDPANEVPENNENNNSRTFAGTQTLQ